MQCQGPSTKWKNDFLSYLGFSTDCFTDLLSKFSSFLELYFIFNILLVVVIPLILLRRAHIELRQKITVVIFLSLSSIMIFVAVVRVSTIRTSRGVYDYTWTNLWLYIEAGIATIMVSLTAFRTQFILQKEERQRLERLKRPLTHIRPHKKQAPWIESEVEELPTTPPAAMIGLGNAARGGKTRLSAMSTSLKEKPMKKNTRLSIMVDKRVSVYSDREDSDPFITSPSWLKVTHASSQDSNV